MVPLKFSRSCLPVALLALSCSEGPEDLFTADEVEAYGELSPLPVLPADPTNAYADDLDAAAFGQQLFFTKALSAELEEDSELGMAGESGKINCATCHTPSNWFSDNRGGRTSQGLAKTGRNNMTIVNSEYNTFGEWSGTVDSGWGHTMIAFAGELGGDRMAQVHTIYDLYRDEYNAIFEPDLDPALDPASSDAGRFPLVASPKESADDPDGAWEMMDPADQEIATRILVNAAKSVEAYQRLLVSGNSPFDQFVAGDDAAISESAKRGLKLFIGKANCIACHSGPNFADDDYHNLGMPQMPDEAEGVPVDDEGHIINIPEILEFEFNTLSQWSDAPDQSPIKDGLPDGEEFAYAFRTQPLRHIAETGPYGHSGQFATLREIVEFYNDGPAEDAPGIVDEKMVPLNLSEGEIDDIVTFLGTLTGEAIPAELIEDTSKQP